MATRRAESMEKPAAANKWALFGPSLANFTVQYNFQVIAIALAIAQRDMPQQTWVKTQDKSVIFIGCILGQFTMGYAGDLLGRTRALSLTLMLAVVGAIGSSLGPWGNITDIYTTVIAFRFIIGFGLGGVYPLSATKAAEADGGDGSLTAAEKRAASVGRASRAFFWQGPGMCAPYLLAIVLRAIFRSKEQGLQWRLLLGLGALPAAIVVYTADRGDGAAAPAAAPGDPSATMTTNEYLRKAARDPRAWKQFLGTGGGWFIYDIAFYGFSLMGPVIVNSCFNGVDSIEAVSWQQLVALSFSVPALLSSAYVLSARKIGIKRFQVLGFYVMAASYALYIALRWLDVSPWILYGCYCLLNFTLNAGPSVTTFVLPSATYPREVRSTMNGLSSAAGKLGAVLGTELLPILKLKYNLNVVLIFCFVVCVCGGLLTEWAVEDDENFDPDARDEPLLLNDDTPAADDA